MEEARCSKFARTAARRAPWQESKTKVNKRPAQISAGAALNRDRVRIL
jgi:hypothetical protein